MEEKLLVTVHFLPVKEGYSGVLSQVKRDFHS